MGQRTLEELLHFMCRVRGKERIEKGREEVWVWEGEGGIPVH